MTGRSTALLVRDPGKHWAGLTIALRDHSIETSEVRTCREAAKVLQQPDPPHLVFTAPTLADGTWKDVLQLASEAGTSVNVIAVSPVADMEYYITAMQRGAYDFIVPPFSHPGVAHIVRGAAESVWARRHGPAPGRDFVRRAVSAAGYR
jgi:DNA-binding NtrC family response regulator